MTNDQATAYYVLTFLVSLYFLFKLADAMCGACTRWIVRCLGVLCLIVFAVSVAAFGLIVMYFILDLAATIEAFTLE